MGSLDGSAVTVADVLVVRRTDFGWHCEIDARRVFVGTLQVAPGCTMPAEGERGPVAFTRIKGDWQAPPPPVAIRGIGHRN